MPKSGDETVGHGSGILRRVAVGFLFSSIALLATIGLIGLLLEAYSWFIGARWRPDDINALLSHDGPAMQVAREAWNDFKYILQYGAYFIAAVALLIAVTQIKAISKLMSDYLDARGSIYQLAATMSNAEETAKRLSGQADRLSHLEPTIKLMSEKVEEAMLKIGDLQRLSGASVSILQQTAWRHPCIRAHRRTLRPTQTTTATGRSFANTGTPTVRASTLPLNAFPTSANAQSIHAWIGAATQQSSMDLPTTGT